MKKTFMTGLEGIIISESAGFAAQGRELAGRDHVHWILG